MYECWFVQVSFIAHRNLYGRGYRFRIFGLLNKAKAFFSIVTISFTWQKFKHFFLGNLKVGYRHTCWHLQFGNFLKVMKKLKQVWRFFIQSKFYCCIFSSFVIVVWNYKQYKSILKSIEDVIMNFSTIKITHSIGKFATIAKNNISLKLAYIQTYSNKHA